MNKSLLNLILFYEKNIQSETYIVINLAQLMNNQLFSRIIFVNQKYTMWSA